MNKIIGIVLILIVLTGTVFALNESKEVGEEIRQISVTGTAKINVMPDIGKVSITIYTIDDNLKISQEQNAKISNDVKKALLKAGLKENDITTASYSVGPKSLWENGKYVTKGQQTTNVFLITTKDIKNLGKYIDSAVNAGATSVGKIYFEISEEKKQENKELAFKDAAKNAKAKALIITNELDMELGSPIRISATEVSPSPYYYGGYAVAMEASDGVAYKTDINPDEQSISVTLNVDFEMF